MSAESVVQSLKRADSAYQKALSKTQVLTPRFYCQMPVLLVLPQKDALLVCMESITCSLMLRPCQRPPPGGNATAGSQSQRPPLGASSTGTPRFSLPTGCTSDIHKVIEVTAVLRIYQVIWPPVPTYPRANTVVQDPCQFRSVHFCFRYVGSRAHVGGTLCGA